MTINIPTDESALALLQAIEHPSRREDALQLNALFKRITGEKPIVWSDGVIGYGAYDYHYKNGDAGSYLRIGFAPRRAVHSIYIMPGHTQHAELVAKLGKFKRARPCLHINKLTDIDIDVLEKLIKAGWDDMAVRYPA